MAAVGFSYAMAISESASTPRTYALVVLPSLFASLSMTRHRRGNLDRQRRRIGHGIRQAPLVDLAHVLPSRRPFVTLQGGLPAGDHLISDQLPILSNKFPSCWVYQNQVEMEADMSKPKSIQVLRVAASLLCFVVGYMAAHAFIQIFLQSNSYLRYQIIPDDVMHITPAVALFFISLVMFVRILSTVNRRSKVFVALFANASTFLLAITQQFGAEVIPMVIFGAVAAINALFESGVHHDEK